MAKSTEASSGKSDEVRLRVVSGDWDRFRLAIIVELVANVSKVPRDFGMKACSYDPGDYDLRTSKGEVRLLESHLFSGLEVISSQTEKGLTRSHKSL